ncbi:MULTISPECIES: adenylate/guanylate cyclase domain-containing protein [unclassified Marinobacter]|uniref:adenylate/guanylate cyclase domain-containing protein n=1 Tax=unclassified Marinobacter TaxID=83889 RepID=UPI0026E34AC7|nr:MULTISPECIES: adenylate/guanylate cyclase domain-containing protein [unclassified Marinobacter]MDO6442110.1 adenylate/guanylate cyclase domain-containing protein [Marinobacter sp. 2_MG-2023]MDO6825124.1 adenylate/guanylate cyclase domain-containing protein [Marinobacter sp. 1_MG-2023]
MMSAPADLRNASISAGKSLTSEALNSPIAIPPMPDYNGRLIAYTATAAIIVVGVLQGAFEQWHLWMIVGALAWPHIAHQLIRQTFLRNSPRIRQKMLTADCVIGGGFIGCIGLVAIPSVSVALMLMFSGLIIGGIRQFLIGSAFMAASILVFFLVLGPADSFQSPLLTSMLSISLTGFYICVTAFYSHQQARALMLAKTQIQNQREQSIALSHKLSKYLSPQVWQSIFTGERDVRLETQRKKLAVFFSDIKGFTELSEEMEPEALTELLNHYFNGMAEVALRYGGTIDKFVGDSIMVFFGDPTSRGQREDAFACVSMAIDMRKHMKIMRQKWRSQGIKTPLEIRMGISTGYTTVGNFGAENRMDYTIIGKEVNLASRLESLAEPGEILVSYETFSLIKDRIMCRDKGEITVKGFVKPVPIYEVVDFRRDMGPNRSFMEHEHSGFAMYLDSDKITERERRSILSALEDAADRLRQEEDSARD